jgi:hypothetical protein
VPVYGYLGWRLRSERSCQTSVQEVLHREKGSSAD